MASATPFFAKEEPGAVRVEELQLIRRVIEVFTPDILVKPGIPIPETNLGAIFAKVLIEKKYRGLTQSKQHRVESICSLITPIFQHHGIDLPLADHVPSHAKIAGSLRRTTPTCFMIVTRRSTRAHSPFPTS